MHLEALTAVVFSTFLAAAFLVLPKEQTDVALLGDVSAITLSMTVATTAVAAALFLVVRRIYSPMVLMGISSDLAGAHGIDLRWHNTVYLICVALTVALGVRIMGGLMTAALLAIPACTARNLSHNLAQYAYISMAVGGLASTLGVIGNMMTGAPPGPLIILAGGVLFLGSVYVRTQMGPDAP